MRAKRPDDYGTNPACTALNELFVLPPIALAPPTTATEMIPAMMQYSTTVAPDRSFSMRRNALKDFMRVPPLTNR